MDFRLTMAPLLLGGMLFLGSAAADTERLTLQGAVSAALASNPGLAAIQARADALAAIPPQVETLPDPRIMVNLMNLPLDDLSFTQEGMTQLQLGISQILPYPGKLALRGEAASQEARAALSDVAERRLQLKRDTKIIWWNLFFLDRALEINDRNREILSQFVTVAETRYEVGQGLQQDVLLAQLELSQLDDRDILLHRLRQSEVARLNALLDRPASAPVRLPAKVNEQLPILAPAAELHQRAQSNRPYLQAQGYRTSAARTRIDLAKKDYYPDFKLGAIYGLRDGSNPDGSRRSDFATLQFSMNLPIFTDTKQDRAVDQRTSEWLRQKYSLDDYRNAVASEVNRAITDFRNSASQAALFSRQIIPQARQTVDSMLAGYQVGKVDFLNLVRSQTKLYNYESDYWRALSTANQALAQLAAAVGEENIHE